MVTSSVLRLFLLLAIVIILTGIALIVLIQFDRGYVFLEQDSSFFAEQRNLIDHVYETQVRSGQDADNPLVMKLNKATVVIQSEPEPSPPVAAEKLEKLSKPEASSATLAPVPQTPPLPDSQRGNPWNPAYEEPVDYQTLLLRNNPWSPYYRPGQ